MALAEPPSVSSDTLRCQWCWKEAKVRMIGNFGGLETSRSIYEYLIRINWCGDHDA